MGLHVTGILDQHLPLRVSTFSGPADDRQIHLALVRRNTGGVVNCNAFLSSSAYRRVCIRSLADAASENRSPGVGSASLDRFIHRHPCCAFPGVDITDHAGCKLEAKRRCVSRF